MAGSAWILPAADRSGTVSCSSSGTKTTRSCCFARRHLEHHASVGTPTEAEHVNFGSSPIWVIVLFAINGVPVMIADLLFGLGMAPGIFLAFACYFITVEEMHWRIHLGERLPPVLRASRAYHLAHHARPDARFNIFLPLWDTLLGPAGR